MVDLLESARRASARAVNCVMTATYWEIGRRIVELEQGGEERAEYGAGLIQSFAQDLTAKFGRGFSQRNVEQMRMFYLVWPIAQTPSAQLLDAGAESQANAQTLSARLETIAARFPLPWSHYVKLLSIDDENARRFYEEEALRGGWSVRQLHRQINSLFYQRTLMSKNKAAMLRKGEEPIADDFVSPEEEIKDPLVLEFLDLKDEYSETDLEEALIHHLEEFLLELGSEFTFVGRQRRLRIGRKWYRIDLLFFHRRLRCLVVIDLKIGEFDHADAGQMHMYLNYAAEHWTNADENPPVGLILCAENDQALARYALEGLPNQVMAAEYKLALPDEATLIAELEKTQRQFARTHKPPEKLPAPKAKRKAASKRKETVKTKNKKTSKAKAR
ncbi:MAG: PDDEXK nuclease domain-containing protein [Planctomycetota bacterium]|nr:PDDEXK nuclease domain-containing protein [Planctomycetota bacterium]